MSEVNTMAKTNDRAAPGFQVGDEQPIHGNDADLRQHLIAKGLLKARSEAPEEATPQIGLDLPTLTIAGAKVFRDWRDSLDGQQQIEHARSARLNQEQKHGHGQGRTEEDRRSARR